MAFFEKTQKKEHLRRHGGREVLRVSTTYVTGESAAAQHTQALVKALVAYADRELLPRASRALDAAAANGTGYAFRAHRYCINVVERRVSRGVSIILTTTLDAGDTHEERTLEMCWTQDGAWQKKERHHRTG